MALPLLLILAGLQAGKGIYDEIRSAKYANTPRPDYEIPQAVKDMLTSASQQALQTQLPGQSLAEEKLAAATASGISAARNVTDSPTNILQQTANLVSGEQGKIRDLAVSAATNYNTNQGILRNAENIMGGYEAKQWQWDKEMPYENAMLTAKNLQASGETGIMSGLTNALGVISAQQSTDKLLSALEKGSLSNDAAYKALISSLMGKTTSSVNLDGTTKSLPEDLLLNNLKLNDVAANSDKIDLIKLFLDSSKGFKNPLNTYSFLNKKSILDNSNLIYGQ